MAYKIEIAPLVNKDLEEILDYDVRLKAMGYRRITVKNYVIIYKIVESIKTVYIMRCFYGGRDYEKLI